MWQGWMVIGVKIAFVNAFIFNPKTFVYKNVKGWMNIAETKKK